jgi:hypothetical protein
MDRELTVKVEGGAWHPFHRRVLGQALQHRRDGQASSSLRQRAATPKFAPWKDNHDDGDHRGTRMGVVHFPLQISKEGDVQCNTGVWKMSAMLRE